MYNYAVRRGNAEAEVQGPRQRRGDGNATSASALPRLTILSASASPRLSHRVCILFMYFLCLGVASANYIVMYSIYVFYCLGFASAVFPPPRHCLGIFHCILAIESNSSASALPRPASSYVFLPPRRCLGELYCIFAI